MPGFLFVVVLVVGAWMTHAGVFYQTGQQWFESCWTKTNQQRDPATPQEAVAWQQCEPLTMSAVYRAGFVFGGDPERELTPAAKAVTAACPSNWTDMPIGGIHVLAVKLIEEQGGPRFEDRFLPPGKLVTHAFMSKWPQCPAVRVANGFPKIVNHGGTWDFEVPCKPCEEEAAARKNLGK